MHVHMHTVITTRAGARDQPAGEAAGGNEVPT